MILTLTINDTRTIAATGPTLDTPAAVYEVCAHLIPLAQEHLILFTLTAQHRLIACHTVSIGTLTASLVHPREVFRPAIADGAASVILAHNHPSGDSTPSSADVAVTGVLADAGRLLGIELLDHLIVAAGGHTSLRLSHPDLFRT